MGDFCGDDIARFSQNFGQIIEVVEEAIDSISEVMNQSDIIADFLDFSQEKCTSNCYPIGKCMGTKVQGECFVEGQLGECCINGAIASEELSEILQ